jgi:hypothetical protein
LYLEKINPMLLLVCFALLRVELESHIYNIYLFYIFVKPLNYCFFNRIGAKSRQEATISLEESFEFPRHRTPDA